METMIEKRALRERAQIRFSSIYFALGKFEKSGPVHAEKSLGYQFWADDPLDFIDGNKTNGSGM